jgi:hypothetical protein
MNDSFNIAGFSLKDMAVCMRSLRGLDQGESNMEATAQKIVEFFYESFENPLLHAKDLALVRFFKTHEYGNLPDDLRKIVRDKFPQYEMSERTKCLVLLGTAGAENHWHSRSLSRDHQIIPLPAPEIVRTMPMVSNVIKGLGYDIADVLNLNSAEFVSREEQSYNVFYVPEAPGCPYIPAQEDFVVPYGIKSVLAFGGMLPSRNLFMMIMFSKTKIPKQTAEIFKSLAVSVKVLVVMFDEISVFQPADCKP